MAELLQAFEKLLPKEREEFIQEALKRVRVKTKAVWNSESVELTRLTLPLFGRD